MRLADFAITAAVVAGLSAPAMAQEGSGGVVSTPNAVTNPAPVPATNNNNTTFNTDSDRWVASGFVGTNFSSGFSSGDNLLNIDTENTNSSINFGGQVAYLWGGFVGLEGLAEFSPSFEIADVLLENKPDINTYMANGIVAGHFGSESQYMPYASGGVGAVQMRATIFTIDPAFAPNIDLSTIGTRSESGSRFGWNLGGGVMGFAGKWGFRGDVRYYRSSTDNNIDLTDLTTGNVFSQAVLSGFSFWKANVGVAFRW
jgi:outer membrane protein with beta-barrel domain